MSKLSTSSAAILLWWNLSTHSPGITGGPRATFTKSSFGKASTASTPTRGWENRALINLFSVFEASVDLAIISQPSATKKDATVTRVAEFLKGEKLLSSKEVRKKLRPKVSDAPNRGVEYVR